MAPRNGDAAPGVGALNLFSSDEPFKIEYPGC